MPADRDGDGVGFGDGFTDLAGLGRAVVGDGFTVVAEGSTGVGEGVSAGVAVAAEGCAAAALAGCRPGSSG